MKTLIKPPSSREMHPDSAAWEKWKEDNADCFIAASLGSSHPDYYLENRLWRAFADGMKAARKATPTTPKNEQ